MRALVRIFLDELPERVRMLESAWSAGDAQRISSLAHQLKGAGAGYGYESLTSAAAALEGALDDAGRGLDAAHEEFVTLIDLCRRAVL